MAFSQIDIEGTHLFYKQPHFRVNPQVAIKFPEGVANNIQKGRTSIHMPVPQGEGDWRQLGSGFV